jgi:hypothetical protein
MVTYRGPGVYREDVFSTPTVELRTGVPAFLGLASQGSINSPQMLTLWPQFKEQFGGPVNDGLLASAVSGFFRNGGELCYVIRLTDESLTALTEGLANLQILDAIDLVCAPDCAALRPSTDLPLLEDLPGIWKNYIERLLKQWGVAPKPEDVQAMQAAIVSHCDACGDRFALLDALPGATPAEVLAQRRGLNGTNAALYYPWVQISDGSERLQGFVPPCGHVAGVYAATDRRIGIHKAPANEALAGVVDVATRLTDAQQGELNPVGVNCLRAFAGRGIRVWGARTLSNDPNWTYINVRRLFLTAGRWIERHMAWAAFEPNDPKLWSRIRRELTAYFGTLFQQGALRGASAQEAFYVKCDAENNPPAISEIGQVITEIGLAPAVPGEFIVVRITHGPGGVTIEA